MMNRITYTVLAPINNIPMELLNYKLPFFEMNISIIHVTERDKVKFNPIYSIFSSKRFFLVDNIFEIIYSTDTSNISHNHIKNIMHIPNIKFK